MRVTYFDTEDRKKRKLMHVCSGATRNTITDAKKMFRRLTTTTDEKGRNEMKVRVF